MGREATKGFSQVSKEALKTAGVISRSMELALRGNSRTGGGQSGGGGLFSGLMGSFFKGGAMGVCFFGVSKIADLRKQLLLLRSRYWRFDHGGIECRSDQPKIQGRF